MAVAQVAGAPAGQFLRAQRPRRASAAHPRPDPSPTPRLLRVDRGQPGRQLPALPDLRSGRDRLRHPGDPAPAGARPDSAAPCTPADPARTRPPDRAGRPCAWATPGGEHQGGTRTKRKLMADSDARPARRHRHTHWPPAVVNRLILEVLRSGACTACSTGNCARCATAPPTGGRPACRCATPWRGSGTSCLSATPRCTAR